MNKPENLLKNPSFEDGWDHVGSCQIPTHWDFWFAPRDFPNWEDSSDAAKFSEPDMVHLTRGDIPEHEWDDFFFDDSDYTLKIFAPKWKTAYVQLTQQVAVAKGYTYKLTVRLNPDIVDDWVDGEKDPAPDPKSGQMRFTIGVAPQLFPLDWFPMTPFLSPKVYVYEFKSNFTGAIDIGAEWVFPHPLTGGSAVFTDAWELVVIGEPEPIPCRGAPREQYASVVNVIPPEATDERATEIFLAGWQKSRQMTGGSYDQAGIGDLDDRAAVLHDIPEPEQQAYLNFYGEYYPGVKVVFEGDLGPTVSPFMLPTYHMQRPFTGWIEGVERLYLADKPLKWVFIVHEGMENINLIREKSPGTKGVFRLVISQSEQGDLLNNPDPRAAAFSLWGRFGESALRNRIDAVCSVNETIGTGPGADDQRLKTVAFDSAFAEIVAQESQGEIAPVTLLAAPGNPGHGPETEMLVPAVVATAAANGYIGPHTYFPCHPSPGVSERWMAEEGLHYHLRPMLSWHPTFKAAGVTDLPPLLLLETGAVGAYLRDDGRPGGFITSGMGWRDPGCLNSNLLRYLKLLVTYVRQIGVLNKEHNYFVGPLVELLAIFTQGYVGWEKFQFNEEFEQLFDLLLED